MFADTDNESRRSNVLGIARSSIARKLYGISVRWSAATSSSPCRLSRMEALQGLQQSPKAAVARNDAINNYFANNEESEAYLSPQNAQVSFSLDSAIDTESSDGKPILCLDAFVSADNISEEYEHSCGAYFDQAYSPLDFQPYGMVDPPRSAEWYSCDPTMDAQVSLLDQNDAKTTLMLRHIPNQYTRDMILSELTERGVLEYIDFLYLPIDATSHHLNVGYCFLNVINNVVVPLVWEALDGVKLMKVKSTKRCVISLGHVQGLESNITAYRNSSLMNLSDSVRPILLKNGKRISFPKPLEVAPQFNREGAKSKRRVWSKYA